MKKIILIAATWLMFASCTKETMAPEQELATANLTTGEAKEITTFAIVDWAGDPAADGLGWVLRTSDNTSEIPTNLPEQYMVDETPVNVTYRTTSQRFPCRCAEPKMMVEIISIERAK